MRIQTKTNGIIDDLTNKYPLHQLYRFFYRFFVSGKKNFSSWLPGEQTEPGFLTGCIFSFFYELNHIKGPLTTNIIKRIHANVISGVLNTNYTEKDFKNKKTSFREAGEYVQFGLIPGSNLSKLGLKELLKESKNNKYGYAVKTIINPNTNKKYNVLQCMSDQSEKDVSNILQWYNATLKKLKQQGSVNKLMLIKVICKLVTILERLHPFKDGNCRTFGLILLNRELIRNGLKPTILDDPNQLDGFSQSELCAKIIEGQNRYAEILANGNLTNTPFRSANIYQNNKMKIKIFKSSLFKMNLHNFDNIIVNDSLEIDNNSKIFQGKPESDFEIIIHRLLVGGAINKLNNLDKSKISLTLSDRIYKKSKLFSNKYNNYFYAKDIADLICKLDFQSKTELLTVATYFGASNISDILSNILTNPNNKNELVDYLFKHKNQEYSFLGYTTIIGRKDVTSDILKSDKLPLFYITKCLKFDLYQAWKLNNLNLSCTLSNEVIKSDILNDKSFPATLKFYIKSLEYYKNAKRKQNTPSLFNWISKKLNYNKKDLVLEANKFINNLGNIIFNDKSIKSTKQLYEAIKNNCPEKLKPALESCCKNKDRLSNKLVII